MQIGRPQAIFQTQQGVRQEGLNLLCPRSLHFLKNGPTLASFLFILSFQTPITIFTTNKCEKHVHPVYGAGIQTHDLWNMSLLP